MEKLFFKMLERVGLMYDASNELGFTNILRGIGSYVKTFHFSEYELMLICKLNIGFLIALDWNFC